MSRARRKRNRHRSDTHLLDLEILRDTIHDHLLEDLRLYVGRPEDYIPLVFKECLETLKETGRYYLTEKDNEKDLDKIWEMFNFEFDPIKYRQIVVRNGSLSYRMEDYRERIADFYMAVFDSIYTTVTKAVVKKHKASDASKSNILDYECKVSRTKYDEDDLELSCICVFKETLTLGIENLIGDSYVD